MYNGQPYPGLLFILMMLLFPAMVTAQAEPFTLTVINTKPSGTVNDYRLAHPFEIVFARDNHLFITEKVGRILRVDPVTGIRQVVLDHRALTFLTITRDGSGAATGIGQDGMMGLALHPNFGNGTGQDSVFVAYTYSAGNVRISRFNFSATPSPSLVGETVLIQGIPASNDHSSGRLIIGGDNKLYYTCGDLGANQFGNRCNTIRSQTIPTAGEIGVSNYINYAGKTLRINLDGSIPADNPVLAGTQSHIFTTGHRNPQGLVWEKVAANGFAYPVNQPAGKLFSSEHGPRTDDEINVLTAGKNYGWPYISGYNDNINYQYVNWSSSPSCSSTPYNENTIPPGATVTQENVYSSLPDFEPPMVTMYTTCGTLPLSICDAGGTNWMRYPTIAPSGLDFYHVGSGLGIPGWYPSLLVPTLRKGTLYRFKLNSSMNGVVGDSIPYFRTTNRYRDIALSPDGKKIYLVTDSIGSTSGPSGTGTSALSDRGAILEYTYTGPDMLNYVNRPDSSQRQQQFFAISPNPASTLISVRIGSNVPRPVHYSLTDMAGKILLRGDSRHTQFNISVNQLPRGVYILRLWTGYYKVLEARKIILK